jgi:predicted AAA+ superfamily ATPase
MTELLNLIREELLIKINKLSNIVPRNVHIPDMPNKIKVVIGMRRTGKTYYLLNKINQLLKSGIPYSQIIYINLEDDRLQPMNAKQLAALIDEFYALYPDNHRQHCYLFFDEIQTVEDWPKYIRRLQDTKEIDIYLTGSSAKLLSKEIATELRGRSVAFEMWPFSFSEYLFSQSIQYLAPKNKIDLDKYTLLLQNYLLTGGFPEITVYPFMEKNKVLQDYVDVVIYRDIIERYKITNLDLIKYMIKYLVKNAATNISLNKLYNDLKSQGYTIGRTTVYDYLNYISDAYLAFLVPLYSDSIRKTQSNPRKVYTIDTGLTKAYSLSNTMNIGHLFENMIYLDLRRRGDEIYFYHTHEKYEIDFFTRSIDGTLHLYQVAWDISQPETLEREQRALTSAEKELGIKGQLITPATYLQSDFI